MKNLLSVCLLLFLSVQTFGKTQQEKPDTLIIGYYPSAPFIIETEDGPEGISIWLWDAIQKKSGYPYKMKKMTLNQVVEGIANEEVDMTLNPLTITWGRSKIMDFSVPYYISNSAVMVPAVSSFEKGLQFIGSFFSLNFFRAIGALFMIVFIFGTLAWVFEHRKNPEEFKPGLRGLWSGIWWSAVTMTTVGYGDKSPRTTGGRVIALIWMFSAIIIISGFTASIASSLTVNQLSWNQSSIDSFKDKKVAVIKNSATDEFLEQRFFKKLQKFTTLKQCSEALASGKVEAVAHDKPQIQHIINLDTLGQFDVLPISYNSQLYAFGFRETISNETKEQITNNILEVVESMDWRVLLSEYGLLEE